MRLMMKRCLTVWLLSLAGLATGRGQAATDSPSASGNASGLVLTNSGAAIADSEETSTKVAPFQVNPLKLPNKRLVTYDVPPPELANLPPQTVTDLKLRLVKAVDDGEYETALGFANSGLELDPLDFSLLKMKASCLAKLHRFRASIAAYRAALVVQPKNVNAVVSLAELLLITGEVGEYRSLKAECVTEIESAYTGLPSKYFDVLEAYYAGDERQLRASGTRLLAALPSGKDSQMRNWDFDELLYVTGQQPPSRKKVLLLTVVRVLMGELGRDEGLQMLKE